MPTRRSTLWPKVLAYGPHLAQLVITRRCNLSCGYCNEYDEVSPPVPTELLKQRLEIVKALAVPLPPLVEQACYVQLAHKPQHFAP